MKIGYVQSWRPEFRDLISSLSEKNKWGARVIRLKRDSSFIKNSADIIIASDDANILKDAYNHVPIVRVSWNGAPEVLTSITENSIRADEYNLTFFTDVAAVLSKSVKTIQVPFTFSNPGFLRVPSIRRVGFIGEVDISGGCFQKFGARITEHAITSASEQSRAIVEGRENLDQSLRHPPNEISSDVELFGAWIWSLNNWVRWRLVTSLVKNFPNHIDLRGNDWTKLGYQAKRSRFNPLFRQYAYQRNAVSMDFGSKSTTDCIYPRTAEIIVNHGGLLQLNSGSRQQNLMPILKSHQFGSELEMLEKVEERFSESQETRRAREIRLSNEFSKLRVLSIDSLHESFQTLTKN